VQAGAQMSGLSGLREWGSHDRNHTPCTLADGIAVIAGAGATVNRRTSVKHHMTTVLRAEHGRWGGG